MPLTRAKRTAIQTRATARLMRLQAHHLRELPRLSAGQRRTIEHDPELRARLESELGAGVLQALLSAGGGFHSKED